MDVELKPINCVNCGAPIDRETMICEYCGTNYKAVTDISKIAVKYADLMYREGPILTPNELRKVLGKKPIKTRGENV